MVTPAGAPTGSDRPAGTIAAMSDGAVIFDRAGDASLLGQVEEELADVEHALARLDDGTYGTCEACGQPIDQVRLAARPEARLCRADQEAAEREARERPA